MRQALGRHAPAAADRARARAPAAARLLDEPTVGLDPQVRQELWALIDALRAEGVSILMSTHYIEEAQRLADTVTIMSHGKAVAVGRAGQLVAEHAGREAIEVYGPPARLAEVEARGGAASACARAAPARRCPLLGVERATATCRRASDGSRTSRTSSCC